MHRRQLGGVGLLMGDAALFAHGLVDYTREESPETRSAGADRMKTALLWSGGGALMAKYGKQSVETQLKRMEDKLADFLHKEGVPLDAEQLKHATQEEKRGWFGKLEDFLYSHPAEVLNTLYGIGGLTLVRSGLTKPDKDWGEIVMGGNIVAGGLATLLLREKGPNELAKEGEPDGVLGKLKRSIDEKPLRVPMTFYALNNAAGLHTAWKEQKAASPGDHNYLLKYLMTASYFASNVLIGTGSMKTTGTSDELQAAREKLAESAAAMLANQPEALRKPLLEKTVEFLAKHRELHLEDEDKVQLLAQIEENVSKHKLPPHQQRLLESQIPSVEPQR